MVACIGLDPRNGGRSVHDADAQTEGTEGIGGRVRGHQAVVRLEHDLADGPIAEPEDAFTDGGLSAHAHLGVVALEARERHQLMGRRDGVQDVVAKLDDTALLDICQVVSYYNYVNRLADGLGVELEDYWEEEALTMDQKEFEVAMKRRRAAAFGETE